MYMRVYFNTGNENKFKELKELFPFEIHRINVHVNEIQGKIEDICNDKAIKVSENIRDSLIITDDVSLEIKGLGGFPGPYIKDFLKIGYKKIENVVSLVGREATVKAVLTLAKNGRVIYTSIGCVEGEIVESDNIGFGFDPIFKPQNCDLTFYEMGLEEKNKKSHRALAALNLLNYLNESGLIFEINNGY